MYTVRAVQEKNTDNTKMCILTHLVVHWILIKTELLMDGLTYKKKVVA